MVRLQIDPPEGSREVIERELARHAHDGAAPTNALATGRDIARLLGDLSESKALAILALRPSVNDLEQAMLWVDGDGDVLDKRGHPLAGTAAAVFDIITADAEDDFEH
jgi:hypothetical protein